MAFWMLCVFLVVTGYFLSVSRSQEFGDPPCYDLDGRPQFCMPPFVNAAFNRPVEASPGSTCGSDGPSEYCKLDPFSGQATSCEMCDSLHPHPPSYMTDQEYSDSLTWWQSETMMYEIQHPNTVNLTLHLGKAFEITYIRLRFKSSRPESFAIYKKTSSNSEWIPYQFYSGSCQQTYGLPSQDFITAQDETKALCTDEFSDISPLSGGSVAFSTLEGRPGAWNFDYINAVLQEWVTATDIKIVLNRMNTFGTEVLGNEEVLKSYYYAISDFSVSGRCKCNGHANMCVRSRGNNQDDKLVCQCEHNTGGPDCGQCQPFYNDRPWQKASVTDANECLPCDCNQMSDKCYFDHDLYQSTGHGGRCVECRDHSDGPHCERCEDQYYRGAVNTCLPCDCDLVGSLSQQCDDMGRCTCKTGVAGEKCQRCLANFFEFGDNGCRSCQCSPGGSINNPPECVADTGKCTCKELVTGQTCDRCKTGYFNLQNDNEFGCMACFCYGHSSMCTAAPGYTRTNISSTFDSGREGWTSKDRSGRDIEVEFNSITQQLEISAQGPDQVYFLAPERYLGDQKMSYYQMLSFRLAVGEEGGQVSLSDVVIKGDGFRVAASISAQGNPIPRTLTQDYAFLLHEHPNYQWMPTLTPMEFQRMLANITAIRIRGTYAEQGVGYIDDITLESARPSRSGEEKINTVELCSCDDGYVGQFCESCAPGYSRNPPDGGPLAHCVIIGASLANSDQTTTGPDCITDCEGKVKGLYQSCKGCDVYVMCKGNGFMKDNVPCGEKGGQKTYWNPTKGKCTVNKSPLCQLGNKESPPLDGAIYIRWGRTTCPATATIIYGGIVGGSHSIQTVGGSNHLCLPEDPTLTGNTLGSARTTVSGAEFGGLPNHYVPCAVCQATRRSVLMIPARNQCHPGWTTEYTGYLSAELDGHQRTEFVCMDDKPEHIAHRSSSHGLFLYPAVTSCGPLPCPPYVENAELLCAVCTR